MSTTTVHNSNPYTPMAWVRPELSRGLAVHVYVAVGSLAVLLWDILLHIPQDYTMMREKRPNISSVVYVIARLSGLAYALGLVIVETAPVGNCNYIHRVYILYPVALPFTSLLLVFRAVACHKNNKYVTAFFALSWLTLLANSIAFSSGIVGMPIENTPYCMETNFKRYAIIGMISSVIHDTLIFVATTWVFMGNSSAEINLKNAFKVIILGRHLLAFSKSLLRDGQLYFLFTIIFHIFVALYFTRQSFVGPCAITLPNFVLINTMSCHLYRNVRHELYQDCSVKTADIQRALEASPDQHHLAMGPLRGPRQSTHLTQEIDPEA